ncbi:polysaccharide lyase family 7 protein [Pseudomonas huanghezhanensis]|uniref:polysaccharide lyase family 7 protein n=1 Tax=Pseudomonas huanghezhanensis TaxID=3002903 RepID=UPI0038B576E7
MIDLATWNLSIPVGTPATIIDTPSLLNGYEDGYFRSGSTLFFWAPVTGSKTENAMYPRTKLRETNANGSVKNWAYSQADNFLRAALEVDQVPSTGKIVIGQIHCYGSTEPLIKLECQYKEKLGTGNLVVKFRLTPTSEPEVIQVATGVLLIHSRGGGIGLTRKTLRQQVGSYRGVRTPNICRREFIRAALGLV